MSKILLVVIGIVLVLITPVLDQPPETTIEPTPVSIQAKQHDNIAALEPQEHVPEPLLQQKAIETQPAPKAPVVEPVKQPKTTCGPHQPQTIYDILVASGVPRTSAIQLIGSWTTESRLDQCQKKGDGGKAWGLNSWHPARRYDMPMDLQEQVKWAVHTEMKRDCRSCYDTIMAAPSVYAVRAAIKQSTRWGVEGARWTYADRYAHELQ